VGWGGGGGGPGECIKQKRRARAQACGKGSSLCLEGRSTLSLKNTQRRCAPRPPPVAVVARAWALGSAAGLAPGGAIACHERPKTWVSRAARVAQSSDRHLSPGHQALPPPPWKKLGSILARPCMFGRQGAHSVPAPPRPQRRRAGGSGTAVFDEPNGRTRGIRLRARPKAYARIHGRPFGRAREPMRDGYLASPRHRHCGRHVGFWGQQRAAAGRGAACKGKHTHTRNQRRGAWRQRLGEMLFKWPRAPPVRLRARPKLSAARV
jgi:hypothetical protein